MTHDLRFSPSPRRLLALAVLLYALIAALTGVPAVADEPTEASILSPTFGRPAFVAPGGVLVIQAQIRADALGVQIYLTRDEAPPLRFLLATPPQVAQSFAEGVPITLEIPAEAPPRTYDLEIRSGETRLVSRHAVAIGQVGRNIRVIHLSNLNVGDLSAPDFDADLVDEVNLLNPTVIVATGDYLDATHSNPAVGWSRLVDWLCRFDAPVVLACGDHDDVTAYSRNIAPSPIGMVPVGPHRVLVLYDQPVAPIDRDADQLHWVEQALARPGFDGVTMVLSHSEFPSLLSVWDRRGALRKLIAAGRIGLWFTGGHRDWDGRAYRELIDRAAPLLYVRTSESSTATIDGAPGVSHYRVIDLTDDRADSPIGESERQPLGPSIEAGRLHAAVQGRNDGSETRVPFTADNRNPFRLNRLSCWVRLKKRAADSPWCQGGRIEQSIDRGAFWECRVAFDLPDKSTLRGLVGVGTPPPVPDVRVRFESEPTLTFRRRATDDGVTFASIEGPAPIVNLTNAGNEACVVTPLIRLDGDTVAYRVRNAEGPFVTCRGVPLAPGESAALRLDLSAFRVRPGKRELQVYFKDQPILVPQCHEVLVRVTD